MQNIIQLTKFAELETNKTIPEINASALVTMINHKELKMLNFNPAVHKYKRYIVYLGSN